MNILLSWIKLYDKIMESYEKKKELMEKGETCVNILVNFICCIRNIEA